MFARGEFRFSGSLQPIAQDVVFVTYTPVAPSH